MNTSKWRPLFLTGGTALRELAQKLASEHAHSIHIVSTFDSGGSSARLRASLAMPAVGDLRNRLLALADRQKVSKGALELFSMRLPLEISRPEAQSLLVKLLENGKVWAEMPEDDVILLKHSLHVFRERMPGSFDARGASLGNLLLTGAYLENGRDLGAALSLFSSLLHIQGEVLPISAANLALGAKLENGGLIIGQHLFHSAPAPIKDIFLTVAQEADAESIVPCVPPAFTGVIEAISRANLICLPMGSFFSSVLPHLLPAGIVDAILKSNVPKVFIPNSGFDPELQGVDLLAQLRHILAFAARSGVKEGKLLDYVLVDKTCGQYQAENWERLENWLESHDIRLLDKRIVDCGNAQRHVPGALLEALINLSDNAL